MICIDRVKLLHRPYLPPRLRVGDRAACALRGPVVITRLSNARIRWPRCRALRATRGGGTGLLLAGDLARAVRQESATAVMFWFGVSRATVARWRAALGVTATNNAGTRRLVRHAAALGGEALHAKRWRITRARGSCA
jgi:hypothetical protein